MSNLEESVIICNPSPPRTRARLRNCLNTKQNSNYNQYESPLKHFKSDGNKQESSREAWPLRRSKRHKLSEDDSVIILSDDEDDNRNTKKENTRPPRRTFINRSSKHDEDPSVIIDLDTLEDTSKDPTDIRNESLSSLNVPKKSQTINPNNRRCPSVDKSSGSANDNTIRSPETQRQKRVEQIKENICKPPPFKPDEITVVWSSANDSSSDENVRSRESGPSKTDTSVSGNNKLFIVDTNGNLSNFTKGSDQKQTKVRESIGKKVAKRRRTMTLRSDNQLRDNRKGAGVHNVKKKKKGKMGNGVSKKQLKNRVFNTAACLNLKNIVNDDQLYKQINPREINGGVVLRETSPNVPPNGGNSEPKKKLREIIVDGSNVALAHSNSNYFSEKGIELVINYFRERGHTVKVFVSQCRRSRSRPLLEKLYRQGIVVFTPSRTAGNKVITSYDDNFIIEYATLRGGIVVSHDQFRDLYQSKPEWRETIEKRLLAPTFIGDIVMFPQDPLGRNGPTLNEFLAHEDP